MSILSPEEVATIRQMPGVDRSLVATHWEGCESSHPRCLAWRLLESHEALRRERDECGKTTAAAFQVRALVKELAEMIVELQNEMAHEGMGSHVPANRLLAKVRAEGLLA